MNNYIKQTSDVNDSTRASAELELKRAPQVAIRPMPITSDMELYLRLGVPDGLVVSSDQPTKIDYSAQNEHAEGQPSIKSESGN